MMSIDAVPEQVQAATTNLLVAKVTVFGEPLSKARPRVTRNGTFTPKATRVAEKAIADAWKSASVRVVLGPCILSVDFLNYTHTRRDLDNMLKLVQDALNQVAYVDDWQIVDLLASKRFVAKGQERTEITLWEVTS